MFKWIKDVLGINKYAIAWKITSNEDPNLYGDYIFKGLTNTGMTLKEAKFVLLMAKEGGFSFNHSIIPFKQ